MECPFHSITCIIANAERESNGSPCTNLMQYILHYTKSLFFIKHKVRSLLKCNTEIKLM
jgi:hypothetical protein